MSKFLVTINFLSFTLHCKFHPLQWASRNPRVVLACVCARACKCVCVGVRALSGKGVSAHTCLLQVNSLQHLSLSVFSLLCDGMCVCEGDNVTGQPFVEGSRVWQSG